MPRANINSALWTYAVLVSLSDQDTEPNLDSEPDPDTIRSKLRTKYRFGIKSRFGTIANFGTKSGFKKKRFEIKFIKYDHCVLDTFSCMDEPSMYTLSVVLHLLCSFSKNVSITDKETLQPAKMVTIGLYNRSNNL